jgi:hypothetical protein
MKLHRTATLIGSAISVMAIAACGGSDLPQGSEQVELDPADFTTEIDNPYWPMRPGSKWVYEEVDTEGAREDIVVEVTDETKTIANGIEARVVRDTASENGEPTEVTDDWYAQDSEGNIWYLGEDTAEYEGGKVSSRAGSFEAGVDGALPGIAVPAAPQPGMEYRQEFYKSEAEDSGRVLSTDELAQVPAGKYRDTLLTKDFTPLEPDLLEYKLYATGVGPVLTLTASGGAERQELLTMDQITGSDGTGPLGHPNP